MSEDQTPDAVAAQLATTTSTDKDPNSKTAVPSSLEQLIAPPPLKLSKNQKKRQREKAKKLAQASATASAESLVSDSNVIEDGSTLLPQQEIPTAAAPQSEPKPAPAETEKITTESDEVKSTLAEEPLHDLQPSTQHVSTEKVKSIDTSEAPFATNPEPIATESAEEPAIVIPEVSAEPLPTAAAAVVGEETSVSPIPAVAGSTTLDYTPHASVSIDSKEVDDLFKSSTADDSQYPWISQSEQVSESLQQGTPIVEEEEEQQSPVLEDTPELTSEVVDEPQVSDLEPPVIEEPAEVSEPQQPEPLEPAPTQVPPPQLITKPAVSELPDPTDLSSSQPSSDSLFGEPSKGNDAFFKNIQPASEPITTTEVQTQPVVEPTEEKPLLSESPESSVTPAPQSAAVPVTATAPAATTEFSDLFTTQSNNTAEAFDQLIGKVEEIKQEVIEISHSRKSSRIDNLELELDNDILPGDDTTIYTPNEDSKKFFKEGETNQTQDNLFGSSGGDIFGGDDGASNDKDEIFGGSNEDFSALIQKSEPVATTTATASEKKDKFSFLDDELLDDDELLNDEPVSQPAAVDTRSVSQPASQVAATKSYQPQANTTTGSNPYRSVSYAPQQGNASYLQGKSHLDLQKLQQQKQKSDAYDFPIDLMPTKPVHRAAPVVSQAQNLQRSQAQNASAASSPHLRGSPSLANMSQTNNAYAPPTGAVNNPYAPKAALQKQPSAMNLSGGSTPGGVAAGAPSPAIKKKQSSFFEELPITTPVPTRRRPSAANSRSNTSTPATPHPALGGPAIANPYGAPSATGLGLSTPANAPPLPSLPQGFANGPNGIQPPMRTSSLNAYSSGQVPVPQPPQQLQHQEQQPRQQQPQQQPTAPGNNRYAPAQAPVNPYASVQQAAPKAVVPAFGSLLPNQQQHQQTPSPLLQPPHQQGPYSAANRQRSLSGAYAPQQPSPIGMNAPHLPQYGQVPAVANPYNPAQQFPNGSGMQFSQPVNSYGSAPNQPGVPAVPGVQLGVPAPTMITPVQEPGLTPLINQVAANALPYGTVQQLAPGQIQTQQPVAATGSVSSPAGQPHPSISLPNASKYAPINHRRQASTTANQYDPNSITKYQSQLQQAQKPMVSSALNPAAQIPHQQQQQQQFAQAQPVARPEQLAFRQYPLFSWSNSNTVAKVTPMTNAYGHISGDIEVVKIDTMLKDPILKEFPFPSKKNIPSIVKFVEKRIANLGTSILNKSDRDELLLLQVLKFKLSKEEGKFDLGEVINYIEAPTSHFNERKAVAPFNKRHLVSLISTGQSQQAIQLALSHQNYALALLISSVIDREAWVKMVGQYLAHEFNGDSDHFLSTLFQVLSGSITPVIDSFKADASKRAWALGNWRPLLNSVIANSAALPSVFLKEFADFLMENGEHSAALVLLVLGEVPLSAFRMSSSLKLNVYLEIYGLILQEKNIPADLSSVHLQQAFNLIDHNLSPEAQKYLDLVMASSRSAPTSQAIKDTLSSLNDRLAGSDGAQGWFGRPKLDKVWGQLDKSLNKFISGDDVKETPKDTVFSKFSPSISKASSSVSLYNQGSEISGSRFSRTGVQSAHSNSQQQQPPQLLRSQTSQYEFYANAQNNKSFVHASAVNQGSSKNYTPPAVGNMSFNTADSQYSGSQASSVPSTGNGAAGSMPPPPPRAGTATFSVAQSPGRTNKYDPNSRRSSVQSNSGFSLPEEHSSMPISFGQPLTKQKTPAAASAVPPLPPTFARTNSSHSVKSVNAVENGYSPKPHPAAVATPAPIPSVSANMYAPKQASQPPAQSKPSPYAPPQAVAKVMAESSRPAVHTPPPRAHQRIPSIPEQPLPAVSTPPVQSQAQVEVAPVSYQYPPPQTIDAATATDDDSTQVQPTDVNSTVGEITRLSHEETLNASMEESNKSTLVPDHSFGTSVGKAISENVDTQEESEKIVDPESAGFGQEDDDEEQYDPEAMDEGEEEQRASEQGPHVSQVPSSRIVSAGESDYGSNIATPYNPPGADFNQDLNSSTTSLPPTSAEEWNVENVENASTEESQEQQHKVTPNEPVVDSKPVPAASQLPPKSSPYAPSAGSATPPVNAYAPKTESSGSSPAPVTSNPYAPAAPGSSAPNAARRSSSANRFTPRNYSPVTPPVPAVAPAVSEPSVMRSSVVSPPLPPAAVESVEIHPYGYKPSPSPSPPAVGGTEEPKKDQQAVPAKLEINQKISSQTVPLSSFTPINDLISPRSSMYSPIKPQGSVSAGLPNQQVISPVESRFSPYSPSSAAFPTDQDSFPRTSVSSTQDRSYSQVPYQPPSANFTAYEPPTLSHNHKIDNIPEEDEGEEEYYDDVIEESDDEEDLVSTSKKSRDKKKKSSDEEDQNSNPGSKDSESQQGTGWFGWLRKGNDKNEPTVYRAKLGNENRFYYDEALGKWVNKDADPEEEKKKAEAEKAPPPPVIRMKPRTLSKPRSDSLSDGGSMRSSVASGSGVESLRTPSTLGPNAGAGSEPSVPGAGPGAGPVPPMMKKSSVAAASDLDSLLSAAGGASTRRKKKAPRGYVDIMAQTSKE